MTRAKQILNARGKITTVSNDMNLFMMSHGIVTQEDAWKRYTSEDEHSPLRPMFWTIYLALRDKKINDRALRRRRIVH